MRLIIIMTMILTGCARTGPDKKQVLAMPVPLLPIKLAQVVVPRTVSLTLEWDYPTNMAGIVGFRVYNGTNSGTYFNSWDTDGITNQCRVIITRLPRQVDYLTVTSILTGGTETLPAQEVSWPVPFVPKFPDIFILRWPGTQATIHSSSAVTGPWTNMGTFTGTNLVVTNNRSGQFYKGDVYLRIEPQ